MTKFECEACKATGLYKGFAEPPGTAVICNQCNGKGWKEVGKTPFAGRKPKPEITKVLVDGGLWMFRTGTTQGVPVSEFYEKVSEE